MKATVKAFQYGKISGDFTLDTETRGQEGIIYDNLEQAMFRVGHGYGCDLIVLTTEQIEQMKNGGVLAWDDGEYVHYVAVEDKVEDKVEDEDT